MLFSLFFLLLFNCFVFFIVIKNVIWKTVFIMDDLADRDQVIYPRSQAGGLPSTHLYSDVPRVNAGELMTSQSTQPGSSSNSTFVIYSLLSSI